MPARRWILSAVASLVACGSFGTDPRGSASASADAGPPALDGGACANPMSLTVNVADLESPSIENGGRVATVADSAGTMLRARGTPPASTGKGIRAASRNWRLETGPARSAHLEFTFRSTYGGEKLYVELGCRLRVEMDKDRTSDTKLLFSFSSGGQLRLGGRQVVGDGESSDTDDFSIPTLFATTALGALHQVALDIELAAPTSRIRGNVDGDVVSGTLNTPLPVTAVSTACGILYADASDEQELSVDVLAATLGACR